MDSLHYEGYETIGTLDYATETKPTKQVEYFALVCQNRADLHGKAKNTCDVSFIAYVGT